MSWFFFSFFFFSIQKVYVLLLSQDDDEFPDLANGRNVQRNPKPEANSMQTHIQPKLPKNLVRKGSVWQSTPTIIQFIYITVDYMFITVDYNFP